MNNQESTSNSENPSGKANVRERLAVLYSYGDDENYEVKISKDTDLDDEFFDWEEVLLKPLEDQGHEINIMLGVSWGWI
jgi:hypothetical protein